MKRLEAKNTRPKRAMLVMADPVLGPGVSIIAKAPITVTPAGLSCTAELFLGPDDSTKVVTSGVIAFTSTGAAKTIKFPVTMPSVGGGAAYHVYLDVRAEGYLLVAFIATEDVIIPSGSVGPVVWE